MMKLINRGCYEKEQYKWEMETNQEKKEALIWVSSKARCNDRICRIW